MPRGRSAALLEVLGDYARRDLVDVTALVDINGSSYQEAADVLGVPRDLFSGGLGFADPIKGQLNRLTISQQDRLSPTDLDAATVAKLHAISSG